MQFDRKKFLEFTRKNGYPDMTNWHPIICCAVRVFDFNMLAGKTTWAEAAEAFQRKTKKYRGLTPKVGELLEAFFLGTPVKQRRFEVVKAEQSSVATPEEQAEACEKLVRAALLKIITSPEQLQQKLDDETAKSQGLEVALLQSMENNTLLDQDIKSKEEVIKKSGEFIDRLCDRLNIRKDGEAQAKIFLEIDALVEYKTTIADRLKSLTEVA